MHKQIEMPEIKAYGEDTSAISESYFRHIMVDRVESRLRIYATNLPYSHPESLNLP
jgi:hypothetical protein